MEITLTLELLLPFAQFIGSQRPDTAGQILLWTKLLDRVVLTPEEEATAKLTLADGVYRWGNVAFSKDITLTETELQALKGAIKSWKEWGTVAQARWLLAILKTLNIDPAELS